MASSAIKAFVFDWAGTMVDFGCLAPVVALQGAFSDDGLPLSEAEARADMGMAKRAHIASILGREPMRSVFMMHKGHAPEAADVERLFALVEPHMNTAAAQYTALIPGAADLVAHLKGLGVRIASGTGYSRSMMSDILNDAKAQGYDPEFVVCAGETPQGRPSPFMTWKALTELGVWPARTCVKVDDAEVGIVEGREAGVFTIGVAASGNGVGLTFQAFSDLPEADRKERVMKSAHSLAGNGADYVIASVANIKALLPELEARIAADDRPGSRPCEIRL
jgi:phosphonoacetaldehyde hydrolase